MVLYMHEAMNTKHGYIDNKEAERGSLQEGFESKTFDGSYNLVELASHDESFI